MARYHAADEVEQRYVDAMGRDLGRTFCKLFNECAWLQLKWQEYVALFGTDEERMVLLTRAAPAFFRLIQDSLWDDILLHISRLGDREVIAGKKTLTLLRLPKLIETASSTAGRPPIARV